MTRKVAYTTPRTIAVDAAAWMQVLAPTLRHPGPGPLDRAALVVLDLQRTFLDREAPAFLPAAPAVVPAVRGLVKAFRTAGRPVLFTRHADPQGEAGRAMEDWWGRRLHRDDPWAALSPDIAVLPDEPVLVKATYSAFHGTGLADLLRARDADTVVLCGVQTHLCVETTARHAFIQGFRPVVVADATAAPDLDLHLGALRGLAHGLARVVLSADVVAGVTGLVSGHERAGVAAAPMPDHDQVPPPPPWGRERPLAHGHASAWPRRDAPAPAPGPSLDLLVIGAGPAGLAAATQAVRMGLRVQAIERDRPGGLVRAALLVENYPGFPGGIRGEDLAARIEAQARAVGVAIEPGEVLALSSEGSTWVARGPDGRCWRSRAVVVASGTRPRRLGVPGEADLAGRALAYRVDEVPRDLRPGAALVVGGGDCALDQALHLWQRGWRVEVLVRGPRPRALPLLVERAAARGIAVHAGTVVLAARERDGRAVLVSRGPDGDREREVDLALVSVGREPVLPDPPEALDLSTVDSLGRAPWPGLYLAGDCRRGLVRQAAVAVGDGVAAAMDTARFLESGRWR